MGAGPARAGLAANVRFVLHMCIQKKPRPQHYNGVKTPVKPQRRLQVKFFDGEIRRF
jgi:hypothetical protein